MPKHRFSLVACARWEEAQIQEWVEYHKSIGFDHIYLYSNDDDPTALFRAIVPYAYGPDPFVTFRHWPVAGEQAEIYLHFLETFKHETEWFAFLDIDEFFVLKGLNNIGRFMQAYETTVDCLYFNWFGYGNNFRVRREDGPTLTTYLRRARMPEAHTKMLCRAAAVDAAAIRPNRGLGAFWHFLDNYPMPGLRCRNVLQASMAGYSAEFPDSTDPVVKQAGFAEAVLNHAYIAHFQFRSEEDFLRRWRRGGFANTEQWRMIYETQSYQWIFDRDNEVYDTYLAAYWHDYTAPAMRFWASEGAAPMPYPNVALNKPSLQSSVFEPDGTEPVLGRVCGAGNNGVRTGFYGFHTKIESRPWWIVDLLALHHIVEIRIYNRRDNPMLAERANEIDVLASDDGQNWTILLSHSGTVPFGLDGAPLVTSGRPATAFRFIALRLRSAGCLHLDEVEAYGYPASGGGRFDMASGPALPDE